MNKHYLYFNYSCKQPFICYNFPLNLKSHYNIYNKNLTKPILYNNFYLYNYTTKILKQNPFYILFNKFNSLI